MPLSFLWLFASKLSAMLGKQETMPLPVICVGNITVGGNGKTPTVLKLLSLLKNLDYIPHIVSRGYKSTIRGPHLVRPETDTHLSVGDEPLMMSNYGHTWISRNRSLGIKSAFETGANIILMDDGFQNYSIKKDLSIVVIDMTIAFGNERIIPAGPLREPIRHGLARADIIIGIGSNEKRKSFKEYLEKFTTVECIYGKLKPIASNTDLTKKKVIAFSGIGYPEKFFSTLNDLGPNIVGIHSFPNHESFPTSAIKKLINEAKTKNALLVTTEKDYVRIPPNFKRLVTQIKIELEIETPEILKRKLKTLQRGKKI